MFNAPNLVISGMLNGQKVVFNTKEVCEIDKHQFAEECALQATAHAWVTVSAERAKGQVMMLEAELEDLDADFVMEQRSKDEKFTEFTFKMAMKANPRRRILVRKIIEADQLARELQALSYAMIHRNDQLTNLSAQRGGELGGASTEEVRRSAALIARGGKAR